MGTVAACQASHWSLELYCFPFAQSGIRKVVDINFIVELKQILYLMYSLPVIVTSCGGKVNGSFGAFELICGQTFWCTIFKG